MWNKGLGWMLQRAAVSAAAIACLIPAGALLVGSLRAGEGFSLAQYEKILLGSKEFFAWFWNSAGYTAGILALCVPVAVLAAYGLSLHRFPGRNALLFLYTLLMLLPFQATVVAQYLTLRALGLLDTPAAIILPCAFGAFGAFLLTQFMRGLDGEILEAAGWMARGGGRFCCTSSAPCASPPSCRWSPSRPSAAGPWWTSRWCFCAARRCSPCPSG